MLKYNSLRALANMFAGESGLRVRVDKECDTPRTQHNVIHMPPMPLDERSDEHLWWWYAFIHECEHNRGDNGLDLTAILDKQIDMRSPYGYTLNVLIDHNIEHKAYGEYAGKDTYLYKGRDLHYNKCEPMEESEQEVGNKVGAVWVFDAMCRANWSEIKWRYREVPQAIQKYVDLLLPLKEEYTDKRVGGQPNMDMNDKIWDILDSTEYEDDSKEGEGGGESRQQQAQDMASNAKKKHEELRELMGQMANELLPHDHEGMKQQAEQGTTPPKNGSDKIDLSWDGSYIPVDAEVIYLKEGAQHCDTSKLSSQVAKLLRVYSQTKWQTNKPRGKINRRALHRVPDGYDKVFRTRVESNILNTTVTLLVDASGSMSGVKYGAARNATAQMVSCLNKLDIPCEVVAFTQQVKDKHHVYVVKDYSQAATPQMVSGRMEYIDLHHNLDGEALNWAHERLAKRKQQRKVLIVLSDGQPNGIGWESSGEAQHLKDVAQAIERAKVVELYAVGIMTEAPKKFYKNYSLLEDARHIERTVINLIKNAIIK